jgi:hypothetical protein
MSKTDKTAPWSVRVFNRPSWLEEHHDHRDGVCDLPPRPEPGDDVELFATWPGHCAWIASRDFWCDRANACGCKICHQSDERHHENRQQRYRGRRYAGHGWQAEY